MKQLGKHTQNSTKISRKKSSQFEQEKKRAYSQLILPKKHNPEIKADKNIKSYTLISLVNIVAKILSKIILT